MSNHQSEDGYSSLSETDICVDEEDIPLWQGFHHACEVQRSYELRFSATLMKSRLTR
jgi:hypothetical protein